MKSPVLQIVLLISSFVCFRTDAAQQVIWFAPLDNTPRPWLTYSGSSDFMRLFDPAAPWTRANSRINVFKMYQSAVLQLSDRELTQIFVYLNNRGIALAIELGALSPGPNCGDGVEGFGPPVGETMKRIKTNGGSLRYIAMDEPFYYGSLYTGPGACRWGAATVASNVAANIAAVRSIFPDVLVGDIEPVPGPGAKDTQWLQLYAQWMDVYQAAAGSPLAFFHADMTWDYPAWRDSANAAHGVASRRNIPFGMIYNGLDVDDTDGEWLAHTEAAFVSFELHGTPPEHAVFQSWSPYPRKLLPETDPDAFTYALNRYGRVRTLLSITANGSSIHGTLTAGGPVSGAPVHLTTSAGTVPASDGEFLLSGYVPGSAEAALVGFRVNMECECAGSSEFFLRDFTYADGWDGGNSVVLDFGNGLDGWGLSGNAKVALQQPGRHNGSTSALHLSANKHQFAMLNSQPFTVRPGSPFTLRVSADVAPKSAGGGYFTVIFLSRASENERQNLPFGQSGGVLPIVYTAPDGFFMSHVPGISGSFTVTAEFAGDETYWPAVAQVLR